ncbi:MAG: FHA domain-containing protein [Deltaproteobacteria bacterium]|nr:FHA domain-containing protein [Deltaproteobacteria bacterium]
MQCARCFFDNPAEATVCEYCGAPLGGAKAAPPVSPSAKKRQTQLGPAPAQTPPRAADAAPPRAADAAPAPPPEPSPWPSSTGHSRHNFDPADPFASAVHPDPAPPPPRGARDTVLDQARPAEGGELAGVMLVLEPDLPPRAVVLRQGRCRIGRDPDCELVLTDPRASGAHAIVRVDGDRAWVLDTSSNGSWIGEALLLNDKSALSDGSVLRVGQTAVVFKLLCDETLSQLRGA